MSRLWGHPPERQIGSDRSFPVWLHRRRRVLVGSVSSPSRSCPLSFFGCFRIRFHSFRIISAFLYLVFHFLPSSSQMGPVPARFQSIVLRLAPGPCSRQLVEEQQAVVEVELEVVLS